MSENEVSVFELDENGQLVYEPADSETVSDGSDASASDPAVDGEAETEVIESEVVENGDSIGEIPDTGDSESNTVENEEVSTQTQEVVVFNDSDSPVPVVLSDEVTAALLEATTPAGGSLGSSTLDYFDRVVSGLPSDYKYVAYRTNSDNSYDGVLYYGDNYTLDDGVVTFEKDAKEITVTRVSASGYSTYTDYQVADAEGATVTLSQSGDIVYYTNAEVGYPLLGGIVQPTGFSPLLVAGLISAAAVVIFHKVLNKR